MNLKINKKYIQNASVCRVVDFKIVHDTDKREVKLLAIAGKYAMVRRPHAMPYVCCVSELEDMDAQ